MGEATIYEKKDHIAVLTMNRPEARNAMNAAMRKEMGEALADFKRFNYEKIYHHPINLENKEKFEKH